MPQRANSERLSMMEPISRGRILTTVKGLLIFALVALLFMLLALAWIQRQWLRPSPALERERIFRIEAGTPLARLSRELHEEGIIPNPRLFSAVAQFARARPIHPAWRIQLAGGRVAGGFAAPVCCGADPAAPGDLDRRLDFRPGVGGNSKRRRHSAPIAGHDARGSCAGNESGSRLARRNDFPRHLFLRRRRYGFAIVVARQRQIARNPRPRMALARCGTAIGFTVPGVDSRLDCGKGSEQSRRAGVDRRCFPAPPASEHALAIRPNGDLRGLASVSTAICAAPILPKPQPSTPTASTALPPTPIALAGLDSIRASLQPTASEYLYFVGMNNGDHYFSRTLAEHNAAVDCYQRRRETANCALPQN